MSRHYLLHGPRHGPNGSDPIDGYLGFNTDNEGGWVYIIANDSTDIDFGFLGFLLADKSGAGFTIVSVDGAGPPESRISLLPDAITLSADIDGTGVAIGLGASEVAMTIGTDKLFQLDADGTLHLKTGASIVYDL